MSRIILHLVKTSVGATWAYRLMRELVRQGYEVHAALPTDGPLIPRYREAGIIIHELNFSMKGIRGNCRELRKIVSEINPDIIHSHFVLTTLVMRLALRNDKTPRIFEVPGPLHLESPVFRNAELLLAQKNDYWAPTCKWSLERYKKSGIYSDRLFLTYYGGEISHFKYPKGKLRKELDLADDAIIIGMVAFMYAPKKYLGQKRGLKGHEDFIDAMAVVCRKYPNAVGVCVGGAWDGATDYEEKVRKYGAAHCPNVKFLGSRKDIGELYQDIDVAVHPSHSENLGGAAESLMLNVPTVTTDIGGFPDIVINGKTGITVPSKDPQSLADAIIYMIEHPEFAEKSSAEGKKLVEHLCDINNTSSRMADIYNAILQKK